MLEIPTHYCFELTCVLPDVQGNFFSVAFVSHEFTQGPFFGFTQKYPLPVLWIFACFYQQMGFQAQSSCLKGEQSSPGVQDVSVHAKATGDITAREAGLPWHWRSSSEIHIPRVQRSFSSLPGSKKRQLSLISEAAKQDRQPQVTLTSQLKGLLKETWLGNREEGAWQLCLERQHSAAEDELLCNY